MNLEQLEASIKRIVSEVNGIKIDYDWRNNTTAERLAIEINAAKVALLEIDINFLKFEIESKYKEAALLEAELNSMNT